MRDQYRIISTSSYDRGVQHLLEMWPFIKKMVPQASLHCFYGWQLFEKFYKDNPSSMAWMEKMQELMTQDGITDHGRIPQDKLVEEYKKSAIWAYPTHFGEISCISAMKAQAYGCEPVVVNYGALKETVQYGRKVEGDIYDQETKEAFKTALIDALQNPLQDTERSDMLKWATDTYSWAKVAKDWSKEFKTNL